MRSTYFGPDMENYQGDLTDILRATGGSFTQSLSTDATIQPSWEIMPDPLTNISTTSPSDDMLRTNNFGDPFCNMRDPLLHELNVASGSTYFSPPCTTSIDEAGSCSNNENSKNNNSFCGGANSSGSFLGHRRESGSNSPSCNIFSRIQISSSNINQLKLPVSPCDSPVVAVNSPRGFNNSAMVSSDMINVNNTGPVQISSPRNLGIKRRKNQAKKVVCIPAPASSNNRPSGEVVPSDLWAWRKYGQKPIKGSPYPRGYYRCSSSKGCSARKQVERSRTDPNMLVITYTSEHNHPWPTQRNALAGSTRSQPTKNNNSSKASSPGSSQKTPSSSVANNAKEEQKESSNDTTTFSPNVGGASSGGVKEELEDVEKQMEMDDGGDDQISSDHYQGVSQSYRPAMSLLDCGQSSSDDFFADLGEIEADPEFELLCQGLIDHNKQGKTNDPFSIFDWPSSSTSHDHHHNVSFDDQEEAAKRGI